MAEALTGIELSKRVAELYGISFYSEKAYPLFLALHEDDARCFQLAARYRIMVDFSSDQICERFDMYGLSSDIEFNLNPVNKFKRGTLQGEDYLSAARTAILQMLVKMKEAS